MEDSIVKRCLLVHQRRIDVDDTCKLLPIGVLQTVASIKHGMWYARSAEFMQDSTLQTLRWMRIFGDAVFSLGTIALALFVTVWKQAGQLIRRKIISVMTVFLHLRFLLDVKQYYEKLIWQIYFFCYKLCIAKSRSLISELTKHLNSNYLIINL